MTLAGVFGYVVRRLVAGVLVLVVVSMATFALFFYGPNDPASQRAMEAMMEMRKIDVAKLEEAKAGAGAGAR